METLKVPYSEVLEEIWLVTFHLLYSGVCKKCYVQHFSANNSAIALQTYICVVCFMGRVDA